VFELFTQVPVTQARAAGGLGIGLSLVRRLVELHGGSVVAHSEGPSRGSEFVVELPLLQEPGLPGDVPVHGPGATADTAVNNLRVQSSLSGALPHPSAPAVTEPQTPAAAPTAAPAMLESPDLPSAAVTVSEGPLHGSATPRGRRILIVDDNADSADSLAMLLQLGGHEAHTAYDGPQGLEAAARLQPEVMLLDLGLPGLDGCELCRRIRQQPWGQAALLIAVTGWGQAADRQRSRDAGFDAHLVKPVELAALEQVIGGLAGQAPRG
jgi:CheY-like chemotaxis protein